MTFKPAIWRPIAAVLSLINVVAAGFAAAPGGGLHAAAHAALAVAFGLWAQRLGRGAGASELQGELEGLALDVSAMRQELSEAQERLDFAERLLAQGQESRRVDQERPGP